MATTTFKATKAPASKFSTAKASLGGKIAGSHIAGPGRNIQRQNPMSPLPGNVSAVPVGGNTIAGVIPVPSVSTPALTTPKTASQLKGAPAFSKGGLVKPGGSGNVPATPKTKVISTKC